MARDTQSQNKNLFRDAALHSNKTHWLGNINAQPPVASSVYAAIGLAAILFISVILVFCRYTKHINSHGSLAPSAGLLILKAPISGTIARIYVSSNGAVIKSSPILSIINNTESPSVGTISKALNRSLNTEIAIERSTLTTIHAKERMQITALRERLHALESEAPQFTHEIAIQNLDVASAKKILSEYNSVQGQGLVSDPELQQQRLAVFNATEQDANLIRQSLDLTTQIAQTREQLEEVPATAHNDESAVQAKLQDLLQESAKLSGGNSVLVTSPAAGVLSALACHVGESVSVDQSLASVTPGGGSLQAQLLVPSEAIGYVRPGKHVELHYASFPYREYGSFQGTIKSVSESALTAGELDSLTEQRQIMPMYRVLVDIPQQFIKVEGHRVALRSGMQLTAEIPINNLRLIQWIFEPLYAAGTGLSHF